jgi:hypothetical protein
MCFPYFGIVDPGSGYSEKQIPTDSQSAGILFFVFYAIFAPKPISSIFLNLSMG